MKVMTAKEAKKYFGVFIDTAQQEPVLIIKRKRPVGIFLSIEEIKNIPDLKKSLLNYMSKEVNHPLLSMLGANKNHRAFSSPSEADKFITELRNEWK